MNKGTLFEVAKLNLRHSSAKVQRLLHGLRVYCNAIVLILPNCEFDTPFMSFRSPRNRKKKRKKTWEIFL